MDGFSFADTCFPLHSSFFVIQIENLSTKVKNIAQEELDLREQRLSILKTANSSRKPAQIVSQPDVTSSCELTSNAQAQYLGGFITTGDDTEALDCINITWLYTCIYALVELSRLSASCFTIWMCALCLAYTNHASVYLTM